MTVLTPAMHILNNRHDESGVNRLGLHKDPVSGHYQTGVWLISPEDAQALVGGNVYLHNSKAEPSFFGGRVTGYQTDVPRLEGKTEKGVVLYFAPMPGCKNAKWQGRCDRNASIGGLIGE